MRWLLGGNPMLPKKDDGQRASYGRRKVRFDPLYDSGTDMPDMNRLRELHYYAKNDPEFETSIANWTNKLTGEAYMHKGLAAGNTRDIVEVAQDMYLRDMNMRQRR